MYKIKFLYNFFKIVFGGLDDSTFKNSKQEENDAIKDLNKCLSIKKKSSLSKLIDLYFSLEYHFNDIGKCIKKSTMKTIMKEKLNKWYGKTRQQFQKSKTDIFAKIIEQFESSKKKFTVYIGHITIFKYMIKSLFNDDYIIKQGLSSLENRELFDMLICPYSCNFIFELHEENNLKFAKIFINGKLIEDKKALNNRKIEIDDGKIYIDDFKYLFKLGKRKKEDL